MTLNFTFFSTVDIEKHRETFFKKDDTMDDNYKLRLYELTITAFLNLKDKSF